MTKQWGRRKGRCSNLKSDGGFFCMNHICGWWPWRVTVLGKHSFVDITLRMSLQAAGNIRGRQRFTPALQLNKKGKKRVAFPVRQYLKGPAICSWALNANIVRAKQSDILVKRYQNDNSKIPKKEVDVALERLCSPTINYGWKVYYITFRIFSCIQFQIELSDLRTATSWARDI